MNSGVFALGTFFVVFGFISDMANYYDQYALYMLIAGFLLMIIGAVIPSVRTTVESKEIVAPERKKKITIDEG